MNNKPKLTGLHINSYALAQGALTMAFTVQVLYLTLFMTDYLGISASIVGTSMLIAKTFDFIVSLVAGMIIEKSNFKHGKHISWLRLYLVHCIWAEKTDVPLMLYSCHPDVLKLWKLDLETEGYYVETLVEYLQNERSLVKTANALHIHRSTLIYRTKKLEELMETDLSDPYNREYILTSVRVLKHFAKEVPYINTIKV